MTRDTSERVYLLKTGKPALYADMIKTEQAEAGTRKNWLKEKPYQLKYRERIKHEQCIKQEKEEDAAAGLQHE